ncbi:MAG: hypothetical protein JWN25_1032 [Verrucomicrobiales bacterium]|nr:hypothetical protein [Verrucomicrobiales bacterium]
MSFSGWRGLGLAFLIIGTHLTSRAQTPLPPGEALVTNLVSSLTNRFGPVESTLFTNLHVEVLNSRLHMFCVLPTTNVKSFTIHYSLGNEGHWVARDWRSFPASLKGQTWDCIIPVETLDLPFLYLAELEMADRKPASPLHKIDPDELGMKSPTQPFWGFIEGFEQGLEGWFPASTENPMKIVGSPVKTGKAALQITIPTKRNSATIITSRIRGAQINLTGSIGVTLQARSNTKARLRFTVFEKRGERGQRLLQFPTEMEIDKSWKKIELPLESLPDPHLIDLDTFGIEAIGEPLTEVFLDDLNLVTGSAKSQ